MFGGKIKDTHHHHHFSTKPLEVSIGDRYHDKELWDVGNLYVYFYFLFFWRKIV